MQIRAGGLSCLSSLVCVSTGPLVHGHMIWSEGHLTRYSIGQDWPAQILPPCYGPPWHNQLMNLSIWEKQCEKQKKNLITILFVLNCIPYDNRKRQCADVQENYETVHRVHYKGIYWVHCEQQQLMVAALVIPIHCCVSPFPLFSTACSECYVPYLNPHLLWHVALIGNMTFRVTFETRQVQYWVLSTSSPEDNLWLGPFLQLLLVGKRGEGARILEGTSMQGDNFLWLMYDNKGNESRALSRIFFTTFLYSFKPPVLCDCVAL